MKLAKKVLVCVVALALMSTVALTAFAGEAALSLTADKAVANNGDTVTVTAAISDAAGYLSGSFHLTWNPEVLEYVSQVSDVPGASTEGDKIAANEATVVVPFTREAPTADFTLAVFTFKVIGEAGSSSDLVFEVMDGDIDGVEITAAATATVKVEEKAEEPEEPVAPVEPATEAPAEPTEPANEIPKSGDAGVAVAAALVVLAGAAFVASKKTK